MSDRYAEQRAAVEASDPTCFGFDIRSKHGIFRCLVSAEDAERVKAAGAWTLAIPSLKFPSRYARHFGWKDGKKNFVSLHNFILGVKGVDHINGDGLDNRRSNLRPATNAQNNQNRALGRANKSGVRGVHRHSKSGRWTAQVSVGRKTRHVGVFDDLEEAAEAVRRARAELMPYVNEARR